MSDYSPDEARPPMPGSPTFVASALINNRVMFDANDIVAFLLTRGKESNSIEAEQIMWEMAQWCQGLIYGTVKQYRGDGEPMLGQEPPEDAAAAPETPAGDLEG